MWKTIAFSLLSVALAIHFSFKYYYNYWKRKQIPYVPSNVLDFEWYKSPGIEYYAKIYRLLKGHTFGGCFAKFAPKLMIRDPDLIRLILIKDFEYFHDRGDVAFDKHEPLTMHLFTAAGPFWKELRSKLSPTFTSGKMKYMFSLAKECAVELSEVIRKCTKVNDTIEIKDFSTRYTIEVISSCAFGLKANTIQDGNSIFKTMALKIFMRDLYAKLVLVTQSALPWVKQFVRAPMVNKPVTEFFYKLVRDTINYRQANAVNRNDFLQLLINTREDKNQKGDQQESNRLVMTDDLITAQCFQFFVAGYETSSLTISLTLYELANNSDIQRQLQQEINEYLKKYNEITLEMLNSMPYLNQVVSETLRKYPITGALNRLCIRRYKIPGTEVFIEKGTEVLIPIAGLHSDPEYFPNPEQFNPDRFRDFSRMHGRNAYLPFGDGPRSCIGSRFANMSVKLALVYLLRDFNFSWCSMTRDTLEFKRLKVITAVKHDIFLKCSKK